MTTCQVCGREVKTSKNGKIAIHGHTQPDAGKGYIGSRTSECLGSKSLPYEVSQDRLAGIIEFHRQRGTEAPARVTERFAAWVPADVESGSKAHLDALSKVFGL